MQGPTDWRVSQPFFSEEAARIAFKEKELHFK